MVDYQLIETVYLDKTQEKGYHVLYFEESKKYAILTFKKVPSEKIISNGRIEYLSNTKEDAIANLNRSITESSELIKKMLPNQTTEIDMVYDAGFIYRKKEKYDLYNSYPDVQLNTKEELISYVDQIIEFCKKENYNKNLGHFITVSNFLILLYKMAVLDKNNPYTTFKKISTALESFKGDQKVSAKFVELQEQTGSK